MAVLDPFREDFVTNDLGGDVAKNRNAPVAPEVQGSRPAVTAEVFAALRAMCAKPIYDVEELGLHVAASGNAYTFARNIVELIDQAEAEVRLLVADFAEARAEVVRWQEAHGV